MLIYFDGGNAFVRSSTAAEVTVGAVFPQLPPSQYNAHRMRLVLSGAVVKSAPPDLQPLEYNKQLYWDLFGWKISICPSGTCPTTGTLSLAALKPASTSCGDEDDNIGLIPDLSAL